MKKKKFLFISNITNRITNFSLPSIEAAQSLGYEFHLAANLSGFVDDASKFNIKVHHIDLARNPFCRQNIIAYKQMFALINQERFDVIHCNTPTGGVLGRLCAKRVRVPTVIYTAHGFHFYKGAPLLNRIVFKEAEKRLAKYTDGLITINREDYLNAQQFRLRGNGEVYHVPGVGVDTSSIKGIAPDRNSLIEEISAGQDSVLLISVGELNRNKNNKVIIKALGQLRNPRLHYILCGIGEEKDELAQLAENLNIKDNVHFLGYRTDIPRLLKSCDIFVMPSYREGLSRSLMEAMSGGLACVVSDIRGNVDLIDNEKGGFLCKPTDVNEVAHAIQTLARNSELRNAMREYNLNKVKQYDVANIKNEIRNVYHDVIARTSYEGWHN